MHNAFLENDGSVVPLVWNHKHDSPYNVLGHAQLENRDEGVYAYCKFNDTDQGQNAKLLVQHGDVQALSIYANGLKQDGAKNVKHGVIREVSLVLAGANPQALIQSVLSHSDGDDIEEDELLITLSPDGAGLSMLHADEPVEEHKEEVIEESKSEDTLEHKDGEDSGKTEEKEEKTMAESENKATKPDSEKTVKDVFDSMTKEQQNVCFFMIEEALKKAGAAKDDDDDEEGEEDMKQNAFDRTESNEEYLSHADMAQIFADAKRCGSLREAIKDNLPEGAVLAHSIDTTGMETATGSQTYGFNDASMLFPDFRSVSKQPEWITRNMDWVNKVLAGVHRSPFSRIKSVFANITEDEARAKGYIKGKMKKEEVFTTLKRSTTPQTIYKKQKLDKDDIDDITDFDIVAWIRGEMRIMLNEEIARAILIGDGRSTMSDDKIGEDHVRPIANDVPLFNIKARIQASAQATDAEIAKAVIDGTVRARKNYKGSGNPTYFTSEYWLTEMLLLEDGIGHKLYKTEQELATALRVKEIVTVEPMEGHNIEISSVEYPLIGIVVNLDDYNVGADKGGSIQNFDDFDIDYNQYKYLIETRISGALIKPYSAITLYLDRAVAAGNGG
jgi:HK97 family phage prohead protease